MLAGLCAIVFASATPLLTQVPAPQPATRAQDVVPAATQFEALVREYDAWRFYEFPELARARGVDVGQDRITEQGIVPMTRRNAQRKLFLEDLAAIPADGLDARDRLDRDLLQLQLNEAIESFDREVWLECIGPLHGPQQEIPQLADKIRFERDEDYVNYLKRLTWVPQNLNATIDMLKLGLEHGRVPPKIVLFGVPAQCKAVLQGGLDSLSDPFRKFPASIDEARRAALKREFDEEILPPIREAMENLENYVSTEYIPHCRETIGASAAPGGMETYRFRLRSHTTTTMSPEEIHALGLSEVARIRSEMLTVIRRTDWFLADQSRATIADDILFRDFVAFLRSDPRFYHRDAESLLAGYRDICKRVDAHLPALFGRLPRLTYGVRAIPKFMAPTQTTAYYDGGSLADGTPGWFCANTHALEQRPIYEMIPLALHEAVPGHHLQIALAQEIEGLREFRRDGEFTAFVEGWALYAERLGIDMGLYENPYDDFGRLLYEMWRSCRLVVDTGMHAKDWSRDRAIAFLLENTALSELNIRNEVDRYISWPGQACAYKIGELKIRELRSAAEAALGPAFSLREFHDVVLGDGPLPLTLLDARARAWIASRSAR